MKKIRKDEMGSLIDGLLKTFEVLAPVRTGNNAEFKRVNHADEICLDFANSRIPPKKMFFPQSEVLFRYRKKETTFQIESTEDSHKERILLGVRPCDIHAVKLLDRVFDGDVHRDPYFLGKREKTIIIAMGCHQPAMTCFCSSMESSPFSREGADIFLTDIGPAYTVDILTSRGKQILDGRRLKDASSDEIEKGKQIESTAEQNLATQVARTGLREKLDQIVDSEFWRHVHEKCIGCGICTFLCPTCHCFDILDEGRDTKGQRVRHWDSCLFPLYTQEASGNNPRPTGRERMRQRIMHKFNYFVESFGKTACVGCGRCVTYCPVNLDIRRVIEQIRDQ